jgi:serine protease Do
MSDKILKALAALVIVAIVLSTFNTYLILESNNNARKYYDAQEGKIADLNSTQIEQMATLQNLLNTQEERLSSLQSNLDNLTAQVSSQEGHVSEMQAAIDQVTNKLTEATLSLSDVAAQLKSLNQSTSTSLTNITANLESVEKITSQVSSLEQNVDAITSQLSSLEQTVDQVQSQTPSKVYAAKYKSVVVITTPLGLGSGFLFENNSTILTNYHVVTNQTEITIEYFDGTRTNATTIGADAYSDLAVLQVSESPTEAKPLTLSTQQVNVGQQVVAVGNPLGSTDSLSVGYISRINALVDIEPIVIPVLQLDLTITFGSSGGPLLDLSGNLVGITNAGTSVGFNYAVPADIINRVVPALISKGEYQHPYVGISMIPLTPELITGFNIHNVDPYQTGLLVLAVAPGLPADQAGLKPVTNDTEGLVAVDIILAVDGHQTLTIEDWIAYVELEVSAGQTVTLTVWRSGQISPVQVTTIARPPYQ